MRSGGGRKVSAREREGSPRISAECHPNTEIYPRTGVRGYRVGPCCHNQRCHENPQLSVGLSLGCARMRVGAGGSGAVADEGSECGSVMGR